MCAMVRMPCSMCLMTIFSFQITITVTFMLWCGCHDLRRGLHSSLSNNDKSVISSMPRMPCAGCHVPDAMCRMPCAGCNVSDVLIVLCAEWHVPAGDMCFPCKIHRFQRQTYVFRVVSGSYPELSKSCPGLSGGCPELSGGCPGLSGGCLGDVRGCPGLSGMSGNQGRETKATTASVPSPPK